MKPPSPYAQRRMAQRDIAAAEIDYVLAHPDVTYNSKNHPDRRVVEGQTRAGRTLKVVVLIADPEFVVTVADRNSTI